MAKAKKKTKLTDQRERFCQEYVIDLDVPRAYKTAYPKSSHKAAISAGARLLTIVNVTERIKQLQAKIESKAEKKAEDVVAELIKIGFSNIKAILTDGNEIKDISKLPDDIAAAIESVQSDIRHDSGDSEGYTEKVKVKYHSKLGALTDLGKHFGIFEKDNIQSKGDFNFTMNVTKTYKDAS